MAKIDSIFKEETKKAESHPKRITKWIHYSKMRDNEKQYCNEKDKEEIETLADLIEASGEVLQDLLVRKTDTEEYVIIAGHKRRRACQLLVEERKKEQYALLPCVIRNGSDVQVEFDLYSSNGHHEKTDYEKMHELERMKYLLETYPEEFPQFQSGRMVERLGKLIGMDKTTVGDYLKISKNLSDEGIEKFKKGELNKTAAYELASLPKNDQDLLIDQGITAPKTIKEYKTSKKVARQKIEVRGDKGETQWKPEVKEATEKGIPAMTRPESMKFLQEYKDWPIWCENHFVGETFYRYELPDGTSIIVKTYLYSNWWDGGEKDCKEEIFYLVKTDTKHFADGKSSVMEIIEYLKKLQGKKGETQ